MLGSYEETLSSKGIAMQHLQNAFGISCAFSILVLGLNAAVHAAPPAQSNSVTPDEALKDLLDGNERFANGKATSPRRSPSDFRAIAETQSPIAVVIACADSRVSPELIFDSGIGELFVIRVAGNVVDGSGVAVKGSIEYAIAELNVPLIVILGHTNCGAIKAAVEHIEDKDSLPGSINGLVALIKPAAREAQNQPGDLFGNVARANVRVGIEKLENLQPILAPRAQSGSLKIVGGVYDLRTGKVGLLGSKSQ
jgi:carbonic anhydrase